GPARAGRDHDVFVCGNDAGAKETVKALLRDFGWETIIDLGDITAARATEQLMPIWLRLYVYRSRFLGHARGISRWRPRPRSSILTPLCDRVSSVMLPSPRFARPWAPDGKVAG